MSFTKPATILPAAFLAMLLVMPACSRQPSNAAAGDAGGATRPMASAPLRPPAETMPIVQPAPVGPGGFVPLGSDAVKDAIHRALQTGQTQRWQDGALSGYAVPSLTTDAHGCRAVRYTIDQTPDAAPASINACDAG